MFQIPLDLLDIIQEINKYGKALIVGGWIRDKLLGYTPNDIDIIIENINNVELFKILNKFGEVVFINKNKYVLGIKETNFEFKVENNLNKDLRINSLKYDPITGEIIDEFGGMEDIKNKKLSYINKNMFLTDSLRALRVISLISKIGFIPDDKLFNILQYCDLNDVSSERIEKEINKIFLNSQLKYVELAFDIFQKSGLIKQFPFLFDLSITKQGTRYHPEGNVWVHSYKVLYSVIKNKNKYKKLDYLALCYSALLHDLGKPLTMKDKGKGIISFFKHERKGLPLISMICRVLKLSNLLVNKIMGICKYHMLPFNLLSNSNIKNSTLLKYSRIFYEKNINWNLILDFNIYDTTAASLCDNPLDITNTINEINKLRLKLKELKITNEPKDILVKGRDLIKLGYTPGIRFKKILDHSLKLQDKGYNKNDIFEEIIKHYKI